MIRVITEFWGYPTGKKRHFAAGEQPSDISAAYADMLLGKGLAVRTGPAAVEAPQPDEPAAPTKGKRT